jgi:hypothetical protein
MFCPKCGADVPEKAAYCPQCGYHFEPRQEEAFNAKTFTGINSDEVVDSVKKGNFLSRLLGILFSPTSEWKKISNEKPRVAMMIFGYLLILALVAAVSLFFGSMILMLRTPFATFGNIFALYFAKIMLFSILKFGALIGTPIIAAVIINSLCPGFGTAKNFGKVMQITTYSFTPVIVAWTMYLIPFGFISFFIHLFGLYGIIILLIGYRKVLTIPPQRQVGFFFTMAGILYGVYYVLFWTVQFIEAPYFSMSLNLLP